MKQIVGYGLLASPFVGFAVVASVLIGIVPTVAILGITAGVITIIAAGAYLVGP